MATYYGPYEPFGYDEEPNGDVWYPHWHIEVKDGSYNEPSWYHGSLNKVDLKAELIKVSIANPGVDVRLVATISTRMVARSGVIVKEFCYEDLWLEPEADDARVFNNLVCCDHDMYEERFRI